MERKVKADKIVVKVGTSTLMTADGKVDLAVIDQLAFTLASLKNAGKQVILVSSGAIGVGLSRLNLAKRPDDIPTQQALAAVGQSLLMSLYRQRFLTYGQKIAQVLLTYDVLDYPVSLKNTKNTFDRLLELDCIPIVNENDTVSVDELDHHTKFGDNDRLAAMVATMVDADLLVMLSDIDGYFDKNPQTNPDAKLVSHIPELTQQIWAQAGGSGSNFGTGGMIAKLRAAEMMLKNGKMMILTNGAEPANITKAVAGANVGTLFGKINND